MARDIPTCLTLLALALTGAGVEAQPLADRLDEVAKEADLSGSIIVTRAGETVLSAGYGMANLELGVPNAPGTKFRIGSITKQFTSMAIMILQDRGRLRVQDRVGDHLQSVPESWQALTLHQLLTHTSGIMHSWALPGFAETMAVPTTLDETLERFFEQPLVFAPGTDYRYSGVGYFLLAKVVEEVSGQPYEAFLDAEIFTPSGMRDSGADVPGPLLRDRASGYVRSEDGTIENASDIFLAILTGGGNLYSTAEDLARWDVALSSHSFVSEAAYAALYRPERESYGYGWRIGQLRGHRTLAHGGGLPGFNAFILRIPTEEICVVVLTNQTPGQEIDGERLAKAAPVARALANTVLDESSSSRD